MTRLLWFLLFLLCTSIVSDAAKDVKCADDLINLFAQTPLDYVEDDIFLVADIDFSLSATPLTEPLGTKSGQGCKEFRGALRGMGHTIKKLKMDKRGNSTSQHAGLFCGFKGAVVEDLVIDSSCSFAGTTAGALGVRAFGSLEVNNVTNKANVVGTVAVGGLIGVLEFVTAGNPTLSFSECVNEGDITASENETGGFLGRIASSNHVTITLSDCRNNGIITGNRRTGGFLGRVEKNNMTKVKISKSFNNGIVRGDFEVGGFVGTILDNKDINISVSDCMNNGSSTQGDEYFGGFVGNIESNEYMNIDMRYCSNKAIISGTNYAGGVFGRLRNNSNMATKISSCFNRADVRGVNYVGGVIGSIETNKDSSMEVFRSINTGTINGTGFGVGGFFGRFYGNGILDSVFSNSENRGIVVGDEYVGGLVGHAFSYKSNTLTVLVLNSANKGSISSGGIACGLVCTDRSLNQENTTVVNSINRGKINATEAYGITNKITRASNVVSMGEVSKSSKSESFWPTKKSDFIVGLYGMDDFCVNCLNVTVFLRDKVDGQYRVKGTGERVDRLLNEESETNRYDAMWTFGLFLTLDLHDVMVGNPVNGLVTIGADRALEELTDLCHMFMGDCIVVDNNTKQELSDSSVMKTGDTAVFCHRVTTSGMLAHSWNVEHGTLLGNVRDLAPYFSNNYILSNARNRKQALSRTTRVDESLGVVISKADTVEVVVNPGGEVTEEEVRDALNDLVHGKGDTPMDVDVVPRGDGSYIVSIVVPADDTDSVVKALESCL